MHYKLPGSLRLVMSIVNHGVRNGYPLDRMIPYLNIIFELVCADDVRIYEPVSYKAFLSRWDDFYRTFLNVVSQESYIVWLDEFEQFLNHLFPVALDEEVNY